MSLIVDLMMKHRTVAPLRPSPQRPDSFDPPLRPISETMNGIEGFQESPDDSIRFKKYATLLGILVSCSVLCALGIMTWLLVSHRDIGFGIGPMAAHVSLAKKSAVASSYSEAGMSVEKFKAAGKIRQPREELEGIILDSKQPVCVIGGNLYGIGDRWQGKTICSIGTRGILLKDPDGSISSVQLKT